MNKIKNYLALLRISHWSKSVFVLLGVFYAQTSGYVLPALFAALAFCLISSAVYIYNDIEDRSEDSQHPRKKHRPLASDLVTVNDAVVLLFLLLILGLVIGWLVSRKLALILCLYLLVNVAYNHVLKLIPIADVLCIAMGFMLRVLAGTVGIGLPISGWLTIESLLLCLFIALNKRRLELQLGFKVTGSQLLGKYNPLLLQRLIIGSGAATFIVYLFYTIYARNQSFYFILTLPFAAIALWRFAWLSNQEISNDDPVSVFLSDRLSRFNLYCFVILSVMALTRGG